MIIAAIILLIYSIINFIAIFIYNSEENNNYSNLPISKETIETLGKVWIGITSICGILCSLFILL